MTEKKPKHITQIQTIRRGHDTIAYVAKCSCGWTSANRPRTSLLAADDDATEHKAAVGTDYQS